MAIHCQLATARATTPSALRAATPPEEGNQGTVLSETFNY